MRAYSAVDELFADQLSFQIDMPLAWLFQKIDTAQKGRLARPARTQNRQFTSLGEGEAYPLEHIEIPEFFVQVFNLQKRLRHSIPPRKNKRKGWRQRRHRSLPAYIVFQIKFLGCVISRPLNNGLFVRLTQGGSF